MPELVALDLPGGPGFSRALVRAWDRGDAVAPIDGRLPAPARASLLARLRPHRIVTEADPDGLVHDRAAPPVADGDALLIATSGTTGVPKVLVHTRASLTAHAEAVHRHLAVDPDRDRWLACLPLAHLGGLGVVIRSVLTDTPVDVLAGFEAGAVTTSPEVLGTTLVSLVPTALDRVPADRFRWVVLGGAADPGPRPSNVVRTYGLTETGGGVVYDGVALPGVRVRLDGAGQILLGGPTLARGLRDPQGEVTSVGGAGGELATGDLGRWVETGDGPRLEVFGRADDLIVTGGENVWPGPVEEVLGRHPQVLEVAVVGRADPEWGHRVVAVVVPRDRAAPPRLEDLRTQVRAELPRWAAPRELVIAERLPRTALGKVRRGRLLD